MPKFKDRGEYEKWKAERQKKSQDDLKVKRMGQLEMERKPEGIKPDIEEKPSVETEKPKESNFTYSNGKVVLTLEKKKLMGFTGSIILFVGVFTPIVSIPIIGNVNYFQNGKGDGVIVLILAVISFILTLTKKYKFLWLTGLSSLVALSITFIEFQVKMYKASSQLESELAENPFKGLADVAMKSVQLQWGWAIMIVGVGLIIAAAAIKEGHFKKPKSKQ